MRLALFKKRQCWCPTGRGWLVLFGLFAIAGIAGFRFTGHFLALNEPIRGDALVIEGWIPDYAMRAAIEEFRRGHYRYVVTSGGTIIDTDPWAQRYQTWADVAAADLKRLGLDESITCLPARKTSIDRTYCSALAVRDWLNSPAGSSVHAINIYSLSTHARRSHLLFEKAIGTRARVGVVALPDLSYDCNRWWRTSEGFREVFTEAIAYGYARCVFPFLKNETR